MLRRITQFSSADRTESVSVMGHKLTRGNLGTFAAMISISHEDVDCDHITDAT